MNPYAFGPDLFLIVIALDFVKISLFGNDSALGLFRSSGGPAGLGCTLFIIVLIDVSFLLIPFLLDFFFITLFLLIIVDWRGRLGLALLGCRLWSGCLNE